MSVPVASSPNTPAGTPAAVQDFSGVPETSAPARGVAETKASFKTTELIVYVVSVLGVLIASLVVDIKPDGQGFSAYQGWFLVTLLTIGYLISRGLAKSGTQHRDR